MSYHAASATAVSAVNIITTIEPADIVAGDAFARWSAAPASEAGYYFFCHSGAGDGLKPCRPTSHRFGAFRRRAVAIEQRYRSRGRRGREVVEDPITVDDLAEHIDKDESPRCSLRRPRPTEFVAEHREIIGLHLPGQPFVKAARHPLAFTGRAERCLPVWRRPQGELTTRTTYRPDHQTYATLQRDDQTVIDEIDAAIEASLKTGACSALTIARATATEILGHHPITGIKNRDLRYDAFARMASLKRYLPGLKDHGHPIADALQVSFWIQQLDAQTSIRGETAEEKRRRKSEAFLQRERALSSKGSGVPPNKMGAPGSIMVTSDVGRELLRDLHPERKLLQRYLPRKHLRSTKDDVTAARVVIANSISILHLALKKKDRWHPNRADGSYTSDWTIIRMRLRDRLSAREIAAQLGLDRSGSDVTRRFKAALDTISEVVDPQKILIPANRGVQTSIERRKSCPVSYPILDAAQRADAVAELTKLARKVWPPVSHYWTDPKVPLWSTGWFNGGVLYNRTPKLFTVICKYQSRGWWSTEEELVNTTIRTGGIWSGADAVWQPPATDKALDLERLARAPRSYSTSIGSLNFCGPVIEKDGKVYPRVYGSNRVIAGGAAVDDAWLNVETVTRFERAATRADDEPLVFEQ